MKDTEALAVRVSHMSKWFTDQSYEAQTLREAVETLRSLAQCAPDADQVWEALKARCATTPDKSKVKMLVAVRREHIVAALSAVISTYDHPIEKTGGGAS